MRDKRPHKYVETGIITWIENVFEERYRDGIDAVKRSLLTVVVGHRKDGDERRQRPFNREAGLESARKDDGECRIC
jgi:hypothetical protein